MQEHATAHAPRPVPESMSDDMLVTLFQSGDERVFRVLVDRYRERIRTLIYSVMNAPDLVDDLSQEVFIRSFRALPRFRFDSSYYTWLYTIAVNLCRDEMRRRKLRKFLSLQTLLEDRNREVTAKTAVQPELSETRDLVADALQRIPERYRTAVVLRDIEDLTYEEIADVLQCSIGTVKSRICRGREALAGILGPQLGLRRGSGAKRHEAAPTPGDDRTRNTDSTNP